MSSDAVQLLVDAGASAAAGIAELTRDSDILFLSLPGPKQIEEVVFGEAGVMSEMAPGKTLVDLSTSSRDLALKLSAACAERGAEMLDAPVSGGPAGAASGDMAFWVGGEREVYDRLEPVLRTMGDKPFYCGPVGSGTVVKLINNLTGHLFLLSMAEAFSVAVKAGIDPLEFWDALRLGVVGKASALNMLTNQFLPGEFDVPAFALDLAFKDVNLATQLGRELGVPMRMAGLVAAEMTEAMGRGLADKDCRIYLTLQLQRAGVEIAVDREELAARQNAVRNQ